MAISDPVSITASIGRLAARLSVRISWPCRRCAVITISPSTYLTGSRGPRPDQERFEIEHQALLVSVSIPKHAVAARSCSS